MILQKEVFLFKAETEEVVYDALMNWCRHNDKWTRFSALAKFIRFDLLSVKFLVQQSYELHAHVGPS